MPLHASMRPSIAESFELIRSKLCDPDFLAGKGLGNEVAFHVFAYDAALEDEMRMRTEKLVDESREGRIPARIVEMDLWDIFLGICRNRGILGKIDGLEQRRGTGSLLTKLHKIATPELFVQTMRKAYEEDFGTPKPGTDALLISGVGKVYPLMRAHNILENAQPVFSDIPLLMLYPGIYDGQSLRLFNAINDGSYYRAFNLI